MSDVIRLHIQLREAEKVVDELAHQVESIQNLPSPSQHVSYDQSLAHVFIVDILPNLPTRVLHSVETLQILLARFGLTFETKISWNTEGKMDISD